VVALFVLAISLTVHGSPAHVIVLKVPSVPQVAVNVAVPAYPVSQVTVVVEPVSPVIDPGVDLSEFATSLEAQEFISQHSEV